MKKTTVIEKFDKEGKLVERVTTIEEEFSMAPIYPIYPSPTPIYQNPVTPWYTITCGNSASVQ